MAWALTLGRGGKVKKILGILTCLFVLCIAGSGWAKIVYVKTDGLDTNSGCRLVDYIDM